MRTTILLLALSGLSLPACALDLNGLGPEVIVEDAAPPVVLVQNPTPTTPATPRPAFDAGKRPRFIDSGAAAATDDGGVDDAAPEATPEAAPFVDPSCQFSFLPCFGPDGGRIR